jgi:hypothetical protein
MKKFILVLGIIVSMMLVSMAGATFTTWKGVDYSDHSITMNAGTTLTAPTLAVTALTGTNGYYTGTLKARGATALNVTNVTRISASGTAYLNATRATTLVTSGNTYLNYTALTDVRASDDGYVTDTLGVGGTSALNYTTVTDLRASDDVYAPHLLALLSNMNATTMTTGYVSSGLNVAGTSALNTTTATVLTVSNDIRVNDEIGVAGHSHLNVTNATSITASGTVQGEQLTSTHDATVLGGLSVTGIVTAGGGTVNGGVYDGDFRLAAGHGFSSTAGAGYINFYNATGPVVTGGEISVKGHSHLNVTNVTTISSSGKGTFATLDATGATFLNGTTVGSGDTLAVTDADKLTVAGVIVPQEMVITFPISATSVDSSVFIAADAWRVTHIEEVHSVTGTEVAPIAANLTLVKITGANAPSAGLPMHNTTISLAAAGTANTVQAPTLSLVLANLTLADGDRIGANFAGTLTTLAGGSVTVHMKRI